MKHRSMTIPFFVKKVRDNHFSNENVTFLSLCISIGVPIQLTTKDDVSKGLPGTRVSVRYLGYLVV